MSEREARNGERETDMPDGELIHGILTSEAFQKAWEECKGIGIGTEENYRIVRRRFYDYDFVRERISETAKEIVRASAPLVYDGFQEEELEKFFDETLDQVICVAVAHFIIGMMAGATWYVKITSPEDEP